MYLHSLQAHVGMKTLIMRFHLTIVSVRYSPCQIIMPSATATPYKF